MRKLKTILLTLSLLIGWGYAVQAAIITSASQLSNTKVYTIKTTRGYMTLNTAQTTIVSSHTEGGANVNANAATDDASKQFGILNINGKYFIYSPKLNKFACHKNWELVFRTDRGIALDITTDGTGNPDGSTLRFFAYKMGSEGGSQFCLNNNNSGNLVLNNYTAAEAGNTVTIEEVEGVTLDESAAMAVWNGTPDFFDPHKVYNITNTRVTKWTANEAGTGLIGTKSYTGASAEKQQFAFFKYDGKQYLYNLGTKKFVAADGSLTSNKADAATINVWYTNDTNYPYCLFIEERGLLFNGQNAGGFSINGWNSAHDDGNKENLVEIAGVDAYDEMLAIFETPSWDVTYNIYFNGNKIGESVLTQDKGSAAEVPSAWNNSFVTFTYEPATITTGVTSVDVTAIWNGPFKVSNDFATAHWYDMAIRSTWYVTSDNKDGNGAYKTVNANAMGLVKDAYLWAFIGNPFDGFKVINKAAGEGYSFGYTDAAKTDAGIPTIMADGEGHHAWKIVASTNTTVPAGSFCLNVPGTNLYINQYGGAGGSLKFWNSGNNVGDPGSAFTVFDVPTNFAEFTANIEAQLTSDITGYFTYNEATRALWKDEYKTNCPYDTYVALQEAIDNPDNLKWPATGFYRIKSKYYDGRYISYAEHENNPYMATLVNPTESISNIVKLTAKGNNKYTITVGGLNATAPAQSRKIGLEKTGAELQAVVLAPGVCTFTSGEQYGALHCADSSTPAYFCVGWSTNADASQWIIEDATIDPKIDVTITDAGYATLNALWPVTIPEGVKAYTAKVNGMAIDLTEVPGTIPAATPVILEGAAGTYTFTITDDVAAAGANDLIGTYTQIAAPNESYVLQNHVLQNQSKVGFYQVDTSRETPNVPANRAYLPASVGGSVKAFFFGDADAIEAIGNGQGTMDNAAIYNVAGQRISNLRRGINIVGGKKVVVK